MPNQYAVMKMKITAKLSIGKVMSLILDVAQNEQYEQWIYKGITRWVFKETSKEYKPSFNGFAKKCDSKLSEI